MIYTGMLPLQITVAFISPPKKITTKKHVSCIFKSPQQCYHFQWICSPHIKHHQPTAAEAPRLVSIQPGIRTSEEPGRGVFGKVHFQHRMGRKCFRKGKVFNHPPKTPPPPKTNKSWKLKRMVFANKESPDLEGFIFKIQCY